MLSETYASWLQTVSFCCCGVDDKSRPGKLLPSNPLTPTYTRRCRAQTQSRAPGPTRPGGTPIGRAAMDQRDILREALGRRELARATASLQQLVPSDIRHPLVLQVVLGHHPPTTQDLPPLQLPPPPLRVLPVPPSGARPPTTRREALLLPPPRAELPVARAHLLPAPRLLLRRCRRRRPRHPAAQGPHQPDPMGPATPPPHPPPRAQLLPHVLPHPAQAPPRQLLWLLLRLARHPTPAFHPHQIPRPRPHLPLLPARRRPRRAHRLRHDRQRPPRRRNRIHHRAPKPLHLQPPIHRLRTW